jgi:hypothetical protein
MAVARERFATVFWRWRRLELRLCNSKKVTG